MNILFVADLVGESALDLVLDLLPRIRRQYQIDFTIVNGENTDKGKGITPKQVKRLKEAAVDVITSGNHIWEPRKRDVLIQFAGYLIRPLNYPEGNIGVGSTVVTAQNGVKVGVINLQGRSFMYPIDCPFRSVDKEIRRLRSETRIIIVDFHAEATAEKQAMGWHLNGKVSALIGTHTHVQTADERILPEGTAYITDAGMCGPRESVIGMDIEKAIQRFILQSHVYYAIAKNDIWFNGVVLTIDERSGKATNIIRLNFNKEGFNHVSATD